MPKEFPAPFGSFVHIFVYVKYMPPYYKQARFAHSLGANEHIRGGGSWTMGRLKNNE